MSYGWWEFNEMRSRVNWFVLPIIRRYITQIGYMIKSEPNQGSSDDHDAAIYLCNLFSRSDFISKKGRMNLMTWIHLTIFSHIHLFKWYALKCKWIPYPPRDLLKKMMVLSFSFVITDLYTLGLLLYFNETQNVM